MFPVKHRGRGRSPVRRKTGGLPGRSAGSPRGGTGAASWGWPPNTSSRPPGLHQVAESGQREGEGRAGSPSGRGGRGTDRAAARTRIDRRAAGDPRGLPQEGPASRPRLEEDHLQVVTEERQDEPRRSVARAHVDESARPPGRGAAGRTGATSRRTRVFGGAGRGQVDALVPARDEVQVRLQARRSRDAPRPRASSEAAVGPVAPGRASGVGLRLVVPGLPAGPGAGPTVTRRSAPSPTL